MFKLFKLMLPLLALAACGTYKPQDIKAGQNEAEVQTLMGQPTGRYTLPTGETLQRILGGPA